LPRGDVVLDFLKILGVDKTDDLDFEQSRNLTWGARQVAAARLLNPHFNRVVPDVSRKQKLRNTRLKTFIDTLGPEPKYLPARSDAVEFYESFRQENEWVRQRYFPTQKTLFNESFDS